MIKFAEWLKRLEIDESKLQMDGLQSFASKIIFFAFQDFLLKTML